MQSMILEQRLSFMKLLEGLLDASDNEAMNTAKEATGSMRPGGPVNLDTLGDTVWLEQFRYVLCLISS